MIASVFFLHLLLCTSSVGATFSPSSSIQDVEKYYIRDLVQICRDRNHLQMTQALEWCNKNPESFHTPSGGYCGDKGSAQRHVTSTDIIDAMHKYLLERGDVVIEFGGAAGTYYQEITGRKVVSVMHSFDGAASCEIHSSGNVHFADFTVKQYLVEEGADLVYSLEVGEHIKAEYAEMFLDNIVRHSKKYVLLSWAVPCVVLGGCKWAVGIHVNEQSNEWVKNEMKKRGFESDEHLQEKFREPFMTMKSRMKYFRETLMVFRKVNTAA